MRALAFLVVVCSGMAACSTTTRTNGETTSQGPTLLPPSESTDGISDTAVDPTTQVRDFFLRRCSSRIHATPHDKAFDESPDAIGPVQLLSITRDAHRTPVEQLKPDEDGRYDGLKYVTVISGSAIGPVSISIAPDDAARARLVYDPERWSSLTIDAGDHTVRFEVCPGEDAQYNGGFIVDGPACIEIEVVDEGHIEDADSKTIPFGTTDC